MRLFKLF